MKKTLYIVGIVAILFVCGGAGYYFITKANIDKQNFNIKNETYIQQKNNECMEEFYQYYEYNNYDRSYEDLWWFINGVDYRIDDIKYSTKKNACIQFWYSAEEIWDFIRYQYKITDETNKGNIYYCSNSQYWDTPTKEQCEKDYKKELKKLWL